MTVRDRIRRCRRGVKTVVHLTENRHTFILIGWPDPRLFNKVGDLTPRKSSKLMWSSSSYTTE